LRFAFGFKHIAQQRLCVIKNAKIVTQKQLIPLVIEDTYRFTVPVDKILKMAKAKVVIDFDDNANQCDMSVQLETLPNFLKLKYQVEELQLIFAQYQAFFDEMGGFLSFMMPAPEGLLIHFNKDVVLPTALQPLSDEQGRLAFSSDWLEQASDVQLPAKPLRITAIIKQ
jgi:hypothetical protein